MDAVVVVDLPVGFCVFYVGRPERPDMYLRAGFWRAAVAKWRDHGNACAKEGIALLR